MSYKLLVALSCLVIPVSSYAFLPGADACAPKAPPNGYTLFHCKGQHQCQSRQNIGYFVSVELFDATDPGSGQTRLKMLNPCGTYGGQKQDNGASISYIQGTCSSKL